MAATVSPVDSESTGSSVLTFGKVLIRGLYSGLAAGAAAALVMLLVEKPIKAALAVEEARSAAAEESGEHHEELFSRATQIVGGMLGVVVVAVSIAVILAIVYARVQHLLPAATAFGRATLLTGTGYVAIALLPALKYPANPPGVGDPATVVSRTLLYVSFLGAGLVVAYLAFRARDWLAARGWSGPHRSAAVAAGAVVAVALMFVVWPANADAIPDDIKAGLLWDFRLASLLLLTTLWGVLGLTFGLLLTPRAAKPS
jgi:hypothetical protein